MGGGGGKGGGGQYPTQKAIYTDPVTGRTFEDDMPTYGLLPGDELYGKPVLTGAQKLNNFITEREGTAKAASDVKVADAKVAADTKLADWKAKFSGIKDSATASVNDAFTNRGLDPTAYAPQIAARINSLAGNVQDLDPNPGGAFAPSLGSDLINEFTTGAQTKNLTGYNKVFDPNYSMSHIQSSMADPYIDNVLKDQFDPLEAQLTNAQKRGQLTSLGYEGAHKALESKRTAGRGAVSTLANNILGADRGTLDTYIGGGRTAAGSAPLGTDFSVDPYVTGANDIIGREANSFGGELSNAVGSAKYADIADLLNAGGTYQGAHDPNAGVAGGSAGAGGIAPGAIASDINKKRGLVNQGAF